jgi:hypothetical protein
MVLVFVDIEIGSFGSSSTTTFRVAEVVNGAFEIGIFVVFGFDDEVGLSPDT